MKFMLLIFGNEGAWAAMPEAEQLRIFGEHQAFTDRATKAGKLVEGFALQPEQAGQRVKLTGGKRVVTDGPFAETREVIGGYYLVDVADKQEALEWAKQVPLIDGEFVECRPVMEMS